MSEHTIRPSRTAITLALAAMAWAAIPMRGGAQIKLSKPDSVLPQQHKHLFNHCDVIIAAVMAGATFALFPVDKKLAEDLQDSSTQANRFLGKAAKGFETFASPGAYYIGGGLFLVGRVTNHPRVADLGWHGTEAVLAGEGIAYLLKGILG